MSGFPWNWRGRTLVVAASIGVAMVLATAASPVSLARAQMMAAPSAPALGTGILPAAEVERLLPASVYFKGQSAPLQLRNAAVYRPADGLVVWASLVDTSGYSTGVRERYQFFLVTETPMQFGTASVPAGAYGGGFLSDGTAILMDPGAHDVATTKLTDDAEMHRPRPLQMVRNEGTVRLYLGRQYVTITPKQ